MKKSEICQWSMVNRCWSIVNGQSSMVNSQWSIVNRCWSYTNGECRMPNERVGFTIDLGLL
ncbi:hypothetical protein H6G89_14290 [Oscillatoria sp. FACHB-1407]|uniref:hypothetical protein n=1 Tax=Oscillatoria sp. FACHB-1407 TaxID=2692847 RepID=UPI0016861CF8|nr:hypothetical protein [Oscillatoria sp. FACHB-1407]MBD2462213.1 hypothetical protein [Oscillatoria sp. FACHB-1407]